MACVLSVAVACEKRQDITPVVQQQGEVNVALSFQSSGMTKVSAYTASQNYETQVNSVQILLFDAKTGKLDKYLDAGTSISEIKFNVETGDKNIWAVVNGPSLSSVGDVRALEESVVELGANNSTTPSTGFIMAGSAPCSVGTTAARCTVAVSRFVSRVALVSVKNSLPEAYGAITVNSASLSNVVGNQTMAGNGTPSIWYNRFGRADESPQVASHIIDGSVYKASCQELTYRSIQSGVSSNSTLAPTVPYLFYAMPNASTTAPSEFSSSFTDQRTVLVLRTSIAGDTYYYPVALDKSLLERNKSYTVAVEITGLGSKDPNTPVEKEDCTVSVQVVGWSAGTIYDVSI